MMAHEHTLIPWKVLITVPSLVAVALGSLAAGQIEIALVAVGALGGYLGRVNGSK